MLFIYSTLSLVGSVMSFFKSQKVQKFLAFGLLLTILVAIPLTLSQVGQHQIYQPRAKNTYTGGAGDYPCGSATIKIYGIETPDCPSGTVTGMTSYGAQAAIGLETGSTGDYTVQWKWETFFCGVFPTPTPGATGACLDNPKIATGSDTISATKTIFPGVSTQPSAWGFNGACGAYQFDLGFKVLNSSGQEICNYHYDDNLGSSNAFYTNCTTGLTCQNTPPTNTPTPPVTPPTDTPTPGVTITDTPTPGITVTDTPTPGLTVTPTNTPGPTATPNPSASPTPTGNPTATPTNTIIVHNNPPKPTLPPTGPGNTIVSIGLVGLVIAVAGLALSVGL